MATAAASYTKVNWNELADDPDRPGWRDLTAPLGCVSTGLAIELLPAGTEPPAARALAVAEDVRYLVAGSGRIRVGAREEEAAPHDAFRFVAGEPRATGAAGGGATWLAMTAPLDGAAGRAPLDAPARRGWDDLADGSKLAPPAGYRHPWPTTAPYASRDYTDALGCTQLSFVVNRMPAGSAGQHHRHVESEEIHLVLEGSCEMCVGTEVFAVREGDAIRVPAERYRSFHNPGPAVCWMLVVGAPIDEFTEADLSRYLAANDWSAPDAPGAT